MTRFAPRRTLAEAKDDAAREAIRAALVEHSGNVRRAAEQLDVSYAQAQRETTRLGLRAWLDGEYTRADRQPQNRTGARRPAKSDT